MSADLGVYTRNTIDSSSPSFSPIEMASTVNANPTSNDIDSVGDDQPILNHVVEPHTLAELPPDQISEAPSVEFSRPTRSSMSNCRAYITVAVLFMINLLNYMDRFTVSGVLLDIQQDFNINNSEAGLLQTAFICSYMILSPIFGYMGDRYSRKAIMTVGIFFWSAVTLGGSFVTKDQFELFIILRACVGVGEASYSTIAPTLLADLFVKDQRSNMLAIFYFAIPVGSGLGYIVGSKVAEALNDWRWALRVTPGLGVLCVIMIIFLVKEPPRGEAEGGSHLHATSWTADLAQLARNKSFMFSSLGFTCVAFVAGALAFWAPTFVTYSIRVQQLDAEQGNVALIFGVITCAAGFLGVAFGSQSAKYFRRFNPRSDPLVCATGLLLCTPFLFFSLVMSQYNTIVTWFLIFVGETLLCLNWSIVADIVLYVVIPTRRSTAEAFQILLSHALGDAGSPYLVGAISDAVEQSDIYDGKSETIARFVSLQYALYSTTFACVLGGGFFLAAAMFVQQDKARVEMITRKSGPIVIEGALSDGVDNRASSDESPDDADITT